MKYFLIVLSTVFVISCGSSNKVANTKKQENVVASNNKDMSCKKNRKTGSRMNTRNCISKEQRDKERKDSQNAMRNALNGQDRVAPSAGN